MLQCIVMVGMSDAGRGLAANHLKRLGWVVTDELPTDLVPKVAALAGTPHSRIKRVVLVVGPGAGRSDVLPMFAALRSTPDKVRILFLDASTDVLVSLPEDPALVPARPSLGHQAPVPDPAASGGTGLRTRLRRRRRVLQPAGAPAHPPATRPGRAGHGPHDRGGGVHGRPAAAGRQRRADRQVSARTGLPGESGDHAVDLDGLDGGRGERQADALAVEVGVGALGVAVGAGRDG
ncbi:MAG: hypothetical protein KJO75_22930, partial [Dactylosporangium sp.]|nr:hypothetical protein [Dactylosporangium sp.]